MLHGLARGQGVIKAGCACAGTWLDQNDGGDVSLSQLQHAATDAEVLLGLWETLKSRAITAI